MDIYEKKYLKYKKKYLNLKQFGSSDIKKSAESDKPAEPAESAESAEPAKSAESAKPVEPAEPAEPAEPIDVVEFGTYQKQYLGVKFNGKIYYVDGFEIITDETHADAPELFKSKNIGDFEEDEKVKYGMLLLHIKNTESKYDDEKFDENLNSLELKLDDVSKFMQQLEIFKFINEKGITYSDRPSIIKNLNEEYEESLKNKFELMLTLKTLKNLKADSFPNVKTSIEKLIKERQDKIPGNYFLKKQELQKEINILTKIKNFEEKERDKNIDKELDNLKNEVPKIDSAKFDEYVEINEREFTNKEISKASDKVSKRLNMGEMEKEVYTLLEEERKSKKKDFIKKEKDEIINIKNLRAMGFTLLNLLDKNDDYHGSDSDNYRLSDFKNDDIHISEFYILLNEYKKEFLSDTIGNNKDIFDLFLDLNLEEADFLNLGFTSNDFSKSFEEGDYKIKKNGENYKLYRIKKEKGEEEDVEVKNIEVIEVIEVKEKKKGIFGNFQDKFISKKKVSNEDLNKICPTVVNECFQLKSTKPLYKNKQHERLIKKKSEELEEKISYIKDNRIVEGGVVKEGEIDKMIKTVKKLKDKLNNFYNSHFKKAGIKLGEKQKMDVFELYKILIDEKIDAKIKEKIHFKYGTKLKQYLKVYPKPS